MGFNPDGSLLATAGSDGFVRLTDSRTGSYLGKLTSPNNDHSAIAFDPTGWLLATVSTEGIMRLNDLQQRQLIHCFPLGQPALALAWSGTYLAVATETVALFSVAAR
jgi:WD40 repeat protein